MNMDASDNSHSPKQRRSSKLLLEGVEYDLSNLLANERAAGDLLNDDDDDGSIDISSSHNNDDDLSDHNNYNNELFEKQVDAARRQSPYRFDLSAMRTLMTSISSIPELQGSFRLSNTGQVLAVNGPSGHDSRKSGGGLLGGYNDDSEEEEEEDLFLPSKPSHASSSELPGRCSVSTVSNDTTSVTNNPELNHNFHDSAINDLVYDEATGTYVYRDFEDEEEEQEPLPQQQEEEPQAHPSNENEAGHYTLEAMCTSAEMDDGEFDDEDHEMEISPGVYVPFRGAKETWQAVATHCTVDVFCLDCEAHLVCVNDCEYTVCPDCRVVNPVFSDDPIGNPFGVGMGFKKEWVLKKLMLQAEKERRSSDSKSLRNQASRRRIVPL